MLRVRTIGAVVLLTASCIAAAEQPATGGLARLDREHPAWLADRDDPGSEGWQTEVLSGELQRELGRLADHLTGSPPEAAEGLAGLVTERFSCGALRPTALREAFRDATLVVRRGVGGAPPAGGPTGDARLAAALEALRAPYAGRAGLDVHFKLFRIEPAADKRSVRTYVRFDASGPTPEGRLQQTATWICDWRSTDHGPRLERIEITEYEEVALGAALAKLFSDCTQSVLGANESFSRQIVFGNEHWMRRMQTVRGIDNFGHHGLAVADVNGDGLEDLYACQTGGLPNLLFTQNADGTATDVSAQAGVDIMERTHAALLSDLDNDGDPDLMLATYASLLVLANDGSGRFDRVADIPFPNAFTLTAADYDLDGDLDVYACNYAQRSQLDRNAGLGLQPIPYHDANNGPPNALFRNDGEWRFSDVTVGVGLDANNRRWSFAAAWADYDEDGDPDLYVANDFGRNNLYRNDGGVFVDVAAEAGVEDSASGMSVSWGDYDEDGRMDLYVGNMFSAAGNRIAFQRQFQAGAGAESRARIQRFARGNSLFRNAGDGTFRDVSAEAAVLMGRWAWSSPFVDINNDGRQDLVVANGYITNEDTKDL
jgi:hypothetical protein